MVDLTTSVVKLIPNDQEKLYGINYDEQFHRTRTQWKKFTTGDLLIDKTLVPADTLESWRRCRNMGIDPLGKPVHKILSGNDLEDLQETNKNLIETSIPFMRHLYGFMEGSHFMVSLFDRQGFLLEVMFCDEFIKEMNDENWVVGALWDEKYAGNNAAGTVVALKRPIQIFGPQHYVKRFHIETVSSAPIFDPDGKFLGGITLISCYYLANPHTLGMIVAAAKAIENELKSNKAFAECKAAFSESEIAYQYQKAVIASIPEALITIDNRGLISLLNDNAKKIFSLDNQRVEGKHIQDILGKENDKFFRLIGNGNAVTDAEVRINSKHGANDYLLTCNPILSSQNDIIGKVIILNEIKRAKTLVTKMMGAKANFRFEDICGGNPRFLSTIEQAQAVSQSDSNVLLLGESGTGKDLFAQAIHNASDRKNGPYVAINCGAIPRDLVTSELFGHSEGAFTGSRRGGSQGKFQLADGGTIFLDEIAETPLELQTALLRVIEDKSVIRIGGHRVRHVDVRIIAATNKDLREEVRKGHFRKDLYYRINVFTIHLIPLSERVDDIPLLVDRFTKKYGNAMGKRIDRIDERLMEAFMRYPWPGNVRELQNVIERMMNMVRKNELTVDLLPMEILHFRHSAEYREEIDSPKDFERYMISKMMNMNLSKSEIARKMDMTRSTLYRKMSKYNIS